MVNEYFHMYEAFLRHFLFSAKGCFIVRVVPLVNIITVTSLLSRYHHYCLGTYLQMTCSFVSI